MSALPTWVSPMLARSGRGMPVDLAEWAIEPKWDGWRCLARIDDGSLRLTSRWRNDLTMWFPELGTSRASGTSAGESKVNDGPGGTRYLADFDTVVALDGDGNAPSTSSGVTSRTRSRPLT